MNNEHTLNIDLYMRLPLSLFLSLSISRKSVFYVGIQLDWSKAPVYKLLLTKCYVCGVVFRRFYKNALKTKLSL